jgi:hypothetical protein
METFAAKKAAETAPGVGQLTDAALVTKDAMSPIRDDIFGRMREIYAENLRKLAEIEQESVDDLQKHLDTKFVEEQRTLSQDGASEKKGDDVP